MMVHSGRLVLLGIFCFFLATGHAQDGAYDPVSMDPVAPDAEFPPVLHELLIPANGATMSGFMLGANGAGPHPTALLLHGFPGNEKNLDLAQSLRRAGYNVLFLQFRGAWGSQGDYSIAGQTADVATTLDYLRGNAEQLRVDTQKLSVIGHSLGGFTALRAAAAEKDLHCAVGLAAANFEADSGFSEERIRGWMAYVDQLVMLNNYSGDQFMTELSGNAAAFDVRNLAADLAGKAVFLIIGEDDAAVYPAQQARVAAAYEQVPGIDLTAIVIAGDHSFSQTRITMQRQVISWMDDHCR